MSATLPIGFNFRASSGYVTDVAPDINVVTGIAYGSSPGYGWTSTPTLGFDNIDNTRNARLAGRAYCFPANYPEFRIDTGAGSFDIRLALGDLATYAATIAVYDGASGTPLFTVAGTPAAAGEFFDATGIKRTSPADWVTNNASRNVTITSTYMRFVLGDAVGYATLAHFSVAVVAAAAPTNGTPSSSVNGQDVTVTCAITSVPTPTATSGLTGTTTVSPQSMTITGTTPNFTGTYTHVGVATGTYVATVVSTNAGGSDSDASASFDIAGIGGGSGVNPSAGSAPKNQTFAVTIPGGL